MPLLLEREGVALESERAKPADKGYTVDRADAAREAASAAAKYMSARIIIGGPKRPANSTPIMGSGRPDVTLSAASIFVFLKPVLLGCCA